MDSKTTGFLSKIDNSSQPFVHAKLVKDLDMLMKKEGFSVKSITLNSNTSTNPEQWVVSITIQGLSLSEYP